MKVIRTSNHDHEDSRGEEYVVHADLSAEEAEHLAAVMNEDPRRSREDFFRAVPDNHVLYVFEP